MTKLTDIYATPTGCDSLSNYLGETPPDNLLVVMGRNRDSDILTESNWHTALERLGGESKSVQIVRFGHWVCGWIEYLCVTENTPQAKIGAEIVQDIEAYPILDEQDYSDREYQAACDTWRDWYDWRERVQYLRDNSGADFPSMSALLDCVRGNYAPWTNSGFDALIN